MFSIKKWIHFLKKVPFLCFRKNACMCVCACVCVCVYVCGLPELLEYKIIHRVNHLGLLVYLDYELIT